MTDKYKKLRDALDDAVPHLLHSYEEAIRALLEDHDALRVALSRCARVLAGDEMNKSSLIRALEAARSALTTTQGEQNADQ